MKSLLISLFLLTSLAAEGAISRVQSAKGGTTTAVGGSFTITLGSTPTAGNLIVACLGLKGTSASVGITQTGVQWVVNEGLGNSTETAHGAIAIGAVGTSPGTVITVTVTGGTTMAMRGVAAEYSGLGGGSGLIDIDQIGLSSTGNSTAPVTTAFTSVDNEELLVANLNARGTFATEQTTVYSAPTNSFTIVDQTSTSINTASADISVAYLERITSSPVSGITAGATIATNQWSSNGLSLRVPASAGGGQRSWVGMLPILNFLSKHIHP